MKIYLRKGISYIIRFLRFSYPVLISLSLLLICIFTGFIVLKSDDIIGWHISFENGLIFCLGIFFSALFYKLESERDSAIAEGLMQVDIGGENLFFIVRNLSSKNYIKNVTSYLYISNNTFKSRYFHDATKYNKNSSFFTAYPVGVCLTNRIDFVPSIDDIVSEVTYEKESVKNTPVFFRICIKSENASEYSSEWVMVFNNDGRVEKCLTYKEYMRQINGGI